jgi:trigger factor
MDEMTEETDKIKTTVSAPSVSRRELEIEVVPEETAKEFEKVLEDYTLRAKLDGFRRGKAPREMVKRLFSNDIRETVIEGLAPRALRESLRAKNISPASTPVIRDVRFKEGEAFRFKALVEVLPEFDLPSYRKVKVKKAEVKVEEADVDRSLEDLRQKSAEYVPVEGRGVADGDYVVVEWKGKDLKTKRFLPTEKVLVLAGHPDNEKSLNENLIGLQPQENRRFVVSYPSDHAHKKLAGRELEYEIKVMSIKEKKVPEINDEWAKDLGEFDNLAALRTKVRGELEKARQESARREMGDEIVRTLSEKVEVELPASLVEEEAQSVLRSLAASLPANLTAPQVEEVRQRAKSQAENNIKRGLLLRKIAERENITVSDEEVEDEIKAMAKRNNVNLAQIVEKINQEGRRDDIRTAILARKSIDFLLENAVLY